MINVAVKSPNSTCTQSSSSTCNGHTDHHAIRGHHDHFNSDATFEVEDSNNYNMRLTSVEHQYEAIKDDGPDLNGVSNNNPLETNNDILHSDQCRSSHLEYGKGISQRGVCEV